MFRGISKKIKTGIILIFAVCLLAGCGKGVPEQKSDYEPAEPVQAEEDIAAVMLEEQQETGGDTSAPEAAKQIGPRAIEVENPSWGYYCADDRQVMAEPLILTKLTEAANEITDTEEWFAENGLTLETQVEEKYICEIHSPYTGEECSISITDQETGEDIYLDFRAYQYPEVYQEEYADYVNETIRCAGIRDDVLYFSISHRTYAESAPDNAYVGAYDLEQDKLLWKSQPLVSNAMNFVIAGDVILCGYGFTAEPDYLYQLDLTTGQVLDQTALKSMADYLILKGDILYVRTYDTDYTFSIK